MTDELRDLIWSCIEDEGPDLDEEQDRVLKRTLVAANKGDPWEARKLHMILAWMLIPYKGWRLTDFARELLIDMHIQLSHCRGNKVKRTELMMNALYLRSGVGNRRTEEDETRDFMIWDTVKMFMELYEAKGEPIRVKEAVQIVSDLGGFKSTHKHKGGRINLSPKRIRTIYEEFNRKYKNKAPL